MSRSHVDAAIEEQQAQVRALGAELRALRAEAYIERGKAIWVDCPTCGTVPPKIQEGMSLSISSPGRRWLCGPGRTPPPVRDINGEWITHRWVLCSGCGATLPSRSVKLTARSAAVTKCDLRCLNAKGDDCNCPCLGEHHGELSRCD